MEYVLGLFTGSNIGNLASKYVLRRDFGKRGRSVLRLFAV